MCASCMVYVIVNSPMILTFSLCINTESRPLLSRKFRPISEAAVPHPGHCNHTVQQYITSTPAGESFSVMFPNDSPFIFFTVATSGYKYHRYPGGCVCVRMHMLTKDTCFGFCGDTHSFTGRLGVFFASCMLESPLS